MNAKFYAYRFSIIITLLAMLLSACAAKSTAVVVQEAPVVKEVQVEKAAEAEKQVQPAAAQPAAAEAGPLPTQAPLVVVPISQPTQPLPLEPGAMPTPADTFFQNYGTNPYQDTSRDHLSTFALDVDTASYTVMRSYVMEGSLPPVDSVRVEEYVNYFNQGYPTPADVAFGIYADGAPSPFEEEGINPYLLRIGVQGYQVSSWERKPASLTFVIDTSGSMYEGNRLEMVKYALNVLTNRLTADDTVSIVAYGTEARVVLNPTRGDQRDLILNSLYDLLPGGTTNAAAGLRLGYEMAMQSYRSNSINRVILCSDGVANVGKTDADSILETVHGYVSEGVYLTTVGFGMSNFNDVLMEQLADKGNGNYFYVDTNAEAERIFTEELTSTLEVIALDAKVQVDFNPDVVAYYRLVGYENRAVADQDFRDDSVDAGEIGAGHSATAVYAVMLRPQAEGRIATVQLRWKDPETYAVKEINGNFNTWDLARSFNDASPYFQLTTLAAQYAEVLRGSPWASATSLSQIYRMAAPLSQLIPENAKVIEFIDLVGRASQMRMP
jgi:Ca-activated chloride channel family protein